MIKPKITEIDQDCLIYFDDYKERILDSLFFNSLRTIKEVYIFKHFEDFKDQKRSPLNEDKKEVYWNASYYESLIDRIKISFAFETFNKAVLLQKGYMVHRIKKNEKNKEFFKQQDNGNPVVIEEYLSSSTFVKDNRRDKYYLEGLTKDYQTISYKETLSDSYQKIIGLERELVLRLREINQERNQLHFYFDRVGAHEVESFIAKWQFLKDKCISTIESKFNSKINGGYE